MKNALLVFVLSLSHMAFAASEQVLLNCSIPGGDTTGAAVVQSGNKLVLQETTTRGRVHSRALSQKEWSSQKIKLHTESGSGARAFLEKAPQSNRWFFTFRSSAWNSSGFVVCQER